MILAYEDDDNGEEDDKKAEKRKTFQRNLEEQGLELELEPSNVSNFWKVILTLIQQIRIKKKLSKFNVIFSILFILFIFFDFLWIFRDPQIGKPTLWKYMPHGTC